MRLKHLPWAAVFLLATLNCAGGGKTLVYPADTSVIAPGQQLENAPGWYRDAVIYQVWVKAYADGVYNDGIGDLPGLLGKLDYLQSLGVNTLWLSPIFECANKGATMHGYDITDYYAINNNFGTKADLKNLIDAVHGRGMRILFDFVPNHTSTSHGWFTSDATQKSYYIWKNALPAGWGYPWGGGESDNVWLQLDGAWFYSAFATSSMADLNYYNPDVRAAMQNVERYWLDRGFDGMRVDAVRYLCETGPGQAADQPDTHTRLQEFRSVIDEYVTGDAHPHPANDPAKYSAKMMIAEAWTNDASGVVPYFGTGTNEFNMCLDFSAPWAIYNTINSADATRITSLWEYERDNFPAGARSATFDSNHDNVISRPGTQYGGNKNRIVLAEALNLLAPGTPIIYYGNEVGMTGQSGTDTNLRTPMDWGAVTAQTAQPESILNWCKYLIQARTTYPALRGGYATLATDVGPGKALAYVRDAGAERVFIVANLTGAAATVTVTDLTTHGVPAGGTVNPILGNAGSNSSLNGNLYTATGLPPYGIRVYYAAGGAFKGTLHGDIQ